MEDLVKACRSRCGIQTLARESQAPPDPDTPGQVRPVNIIEPHAGFSEAINSSEPVVYQCMEAELHFKYLGSPQLIKCAKDACKKGKSRDILGFELSQCYKLESDAKLTNDGNLPSGWGL